MIFNNINAVKVTLIESEANCLEAAAKILSVIESQMKFGTPPVNNVISEDNSIMISTLDEISNTKNILNRMANNCTIQKGK